MGALLWSAHILCCGWYICAALNPDLTETWVYKEQDGGGPGEVFHMEPGDQWLRSLYFVITVFTTVGFGDQLPHNSSEIYYTYLVMFVGTILHSIIIGQVIDLVTSVDATAAFIEDKA